ncbi:hypothetical protein KRP22_014425 [Phytophthora ramorum]|nr:DnaJ-like protein subfamily C member 7 [Phytophthora ramorum]
MVKLVEYPDSSEDERDAASDGSQWSSFGQVPSSPSDSFSYPMRSPESDEDEDYAPSETSLEPPDSDTQSVDTDDLDPHDEDTLDEEEDTLEQEEDTLGQEEDDSGGQKQDPDIIDLTQPKGGVSGWKELQEAFVDNPFKRRSVEKPAEANTFDVEAGRWSFQASDTEKTKKQLRRPSSAGQRRPTGVSPRFSTLSTKEHFFSRECATAFPTSATEEKQDAAGAGQTSSPMFNFKAPRVETPAFGAEQKAASVPKTPGFTFGSSGSERFGDGSDDTHMRSPTPRRASAASFGAVDGGFTIGRSGKAPKPYNFASRGAASQAPVNAATPVDDGDDTLMRSPSPHVKPARTPTNAEFLFGQGYKNRKPFVIPRQNSNDSLHSTGPAPAPSGAAPARGKGSAWAAKVPDAGTSIGGFETNSDPTPASASFTTGVAGPNAHRNSDRRKKKTSSSSVFAAQQNETSSSTSASFGPSLFQTAPATRRRSETSFSRPGGPASRMEAVPSAENTSGSFVFGSSNPKSPTEANPSPFSTSNRGAAPATPIVGPPAQFLFGKGTSHDPFEFGDAAIDSQAERPSSQFAGTQTDNAAFGAFNIGNSGAKKNSRYTSRVRPRKSGMFTNKNSPRKDAKRGENEPEPSPGASASTSTSQSPFGMDNRRSRKNARLRHTYGRSPPADPFVTPTFHNHPSSSPFVSSEGNPDVVRPTANKGIPFTFGASATNFTAGTAQQPSTSNEPGVPFFRSQQQQATVSQSQDSSHSIPQSNGSVHHDKPQPSNEGGTRPAFAGSRRILRAALRGAGVRNDRVSSAPPATTGYHREEGDADMDSEDEHDWLELKLLGGVAHGKRRFEEAAEYYRQSIEVLESQLHHNDSSDTAELRTDKAKLHANRAACLMMLTQITEAQRECQRSIEVDATYARAYLRLGRIQVLLGETAHAQANIDTAKQLMEGHGGEVRSCDQADHASLIKVEETIRKLTVLQGEIKWYVGSGDFKHALEHTESALALAPSCRKLQVQKARILLHQKEFGEIVAFCTSIVEKQLANHGKRSSPANRRGRNAKSLKDRTVEKIAFVGIDLGLLWATTLHYQNKLEDAVRILNVLEDVAPCSSNVFQLKRQWQEMKQLKHNGNARFKEGEYQEAVRFYSEAVQIDPQHFEYCAIIYCNRAAAQMGLERYHTAILDCNEALQRKPQYARALLRRARCYVALKMFHEAVKDFDSYLREQPNELPTEATADVRRERNEAKAAIAKAREEAKQREAAKKRAEREQRQRRSHRWEESSWNDSRFHENFRRGTSTSSGGNNNNNNGSSYGSSRFPSSGAGGRASFMAPKTQRRTHYDVLGIEKAASGEQIKKAYRKLALVYHPDKAKTSTHADLFKEMTAAYNVLSDESARSKYDRELIYNRFGNFYEN